MEFDPQVLDWIFLGGGVLLMFLEATLPGGVSFFMGLSGVLVGALRLLGFLGDPFTAVMVWAFASLGLVLALRPVAKRYFGGESTREMTNEDVNALGETVAVIEETGSLGEEGRIRFRGSEWRARTPEPDQVLSAGAEARIVYRDNLTWVVEPVGDLPESKKKRLKTDD